jgi:hypothetical protein
MTDPIINELWKVKDGLARACGYDLGKLFERLKTAQESEMAPVVDRTKQRKSAVARVAESSVTYPVE